MGIGKIFGKVIGKFVFRGKVSKALAKPINKAPVRNVGLFAKSKINEKAGTQILKDFMDQAGHTEVSLADLQKLNKIS